MLLKADDSSGIIKLGDVMLPGVFQSLSVNGEILIDSSNSEGNQTPRKVMRGFQDKKVSLRLLLLPTENTTVYEALEELETLFHDANSGVPKVYTLINKHTMARNIGKVIFQSLSSSENNQGESMEILLNFEEFTPASYLS
ncbi:hypothetical protein SAMN02745150_01193 [Brevinema andersonii]|uniref:Uncharacterized protein n=1 Tax=Brevinema andersonii TaxID=34097 RepID=A0A1I1ENA7_BREAD|nr:hypothetical protein [Brevinema andersonii]SFB88585.1 hypothetical protein SAMN02745150_01193 [Brevinema andersonii]